MMAKETARKCIVTGQISEKENLLRFTVTPDGQLVPDFKKKLPGKGVYVVNRKTALQEAIQKGLFAKALKVKVKVDPDLAAIVETILKQQALSAVSLSRKAGELIVGLEKSCEALKKGCVAFLLETSDCGSDGHKKLVSAAKDLEIFKLFKSEELDKELAKDSTVHLSFLKGHTAKMVREAFVRLISFLDN